MIFAGQFTNEAQEMLTESGFEPCFVKDIAEGDTIAIEHETNRGVPTEMLVTGLWQVGTTGNGARKWIGILTTGRKVHCSYMPGDPAWRQSPAVEGNQ